MHHQWKFTEVSIRTKYLPSFSSRYHGIYDIDLWSGDNCISLRKCSDIMGSQHNQISSECQQLTDYQPGYQWHYHCPVLYPISILRCSGAAVGPASFHVQTLPVRPDSQCQRQYFHSVTDSPWQVTQTFFTITQIFDLLG